MNLPNSAKTLLLVLSLLLPGSVGFAATAKQLIKQGDVYDLKFNPTKALEYYLPAEKVEPNNAELLLRIARQYRHQATDVGSSKEKLRLSRLGLAYAERAVAISPKSSEAQLSVAISHAKAIELYGNREKMSALRVVKASADKAISLDSRNDLAWYILGRWNQRVAELGGIKRNMAEMAYGKLPTATNEEATKCFRHAINLNPKRSVYYVDMGITCAAMNNKADAKRHLKKGLALPNVGKDDWATKNRGKEVLKTLN